MIHILGGFGYGGTERLCLSLLQQAPSGIRQVVVGLDPSRQDMKLAFLAVPGVEVISGPGRARASLLLWLMRLFRSQRPTSIVIYTFGVAHLIAGLAARLTAVPTIAVSAGNPPPLGRDRWKWWLIVWLSRVLNIPIKSCSVAVEQELLALGSRLPQGSGVIHNGCDVETIARTAACARAKHPHHQRRVVGMVARLDAIKDHAALLRAFAELPRRDKNLDVALWLIGDGAMREALEALASELGVAGQVSFWGARDDIAELLGQMDVYAYSTTRDEGFGIALLEAMAAGLPVVASDVSACREVLAGGAAGILVRPSDPHELADALLPLLRDAKLREQWGRRAQDHARAHYNIAEFARRWYRTLNLASEARAS